MNDYFFDNEKSSIRAPKSARLKMSPYLQPVFPPKDPFFGYDPKYLKAARSPRPKRKEVLTTAGITTAFKPRNYSPPRVDMTYVQRKALYDKKEAEYDKKLLKKYERLNPMDSYKSSMIGAYQQCVIDKKAEMVLAEEEEYRSMSQAKKKRLAQQAAEVERLREQQMKKTGITDLGFY